MTTTLFLYMIHIFGFPISVPYICHYLILSCLTLWFYLIVNYSDRFKWKITSVKPSLSSSIINDLFNFLLTFLSQLFAVDHLIKVIVGLFSQFCLHKRYHNIFKSEILSCIYFFLQSNHKWIEDIDDLYFLIMWDD